MATDPALAYALVLAAGLVAGTVSGIVGTGATVILLPVLTIVFGPHEAVPIMAVVALMSNLAKITAWWRDVDWRAVFAYAVAGIPAAALGARTLLILPERTVEIALGVFYLAMIPGRRWLASRNMTVGYGGLALAGAGIGFLTGVVVSTGPLSVPVFAAHGLLKGVFIATEAAGSLALYVAKGITFQMLGALTFDTAVKGLISGSSVMVGTYVARAILHRISVATFQNLLDVAMGVAGLALLWAAVR